MLCGFATAMFSVVIFAYFFAQNTSELTPRTAAILASMFFVASIMSYVLSLLILRRAFTAMVFCVVCWLGFYLSPLLLSLLVRYWPWHSSRALALTACIFLFAFLAAILAKKIRNATTATSLLIGVIVVIFAMNFGKILDAFLDTRANADNQIPIKKDFLLDSNSKSPNIYWIHPDGMLGVDMMKKYFGDNQEEFLSALRERGFEINPSANFEARHWTKIAIPVLMNPHTYDHWIRDELSSGKRLNEYEFLFIRQNSELQYALAAKGYALNVLGLFYFYYPIRGGEMWMSNMKKILMREELDTNNTLLEAYNFGNPYFEKFIFHYIQRFYGKHYQAQIPEEKSKEIFLGGWDAADLNLAFMASLYDTLHGDYPEPKLTIIHDLIPHGPYNRTANGVTVQTDDNINPLNYHPQHIYDTKILISMIDMILAKDSGAIIVIQADHGLHGNSEQDFKAAFGDKANALEIWNSTMSALRVPDEYKTGEEHYALETPLNMTRYLVNSFVGKNYEYLKQ